MKSIIKKIKNKLKYPGLLINPSVLLVKNGELRYGKNCMIDRESTIVITGSLTLGDDVIILKDTDIDAIKIKIGSKVSIQKHSFIFGEVTIGSFCIFAPNVFISSGMHEFKKIPELSIKEQDQYEKKSSDDRAITIGEDCWLGINVVVLPGVSIGKGCIVGANSVVSKSIPPYSVAVGIPAKVVSERLKFNPPKKMVPSIENIPYFYSGFDTSRDKISQDGISLLSCIVEICLNVENANAIKIKLTNATHCTVGKKKYIINENIITIPVTDSRQLVEIEFDKNEYTNLKIKEIWLE
jgi:acetyltransferase-like isoleucine patch superfamily enzyme